MNNDVFLSIPLDLGVAMPIN